MIIQSLLDTDLYKLTMMQVVLHQFPGAQVEYRFKCRNPDVDLVPYIDEIKAEITAFCQLRMQTDELHYLRSLKFLKNDFIDFLRIFQASMEFVSIREIDGECDITIRGPWLHTILFEVPILAIISEVYFRHTAANLDMQEGEKRLRDKIAYVKSHITEDGFKFSDFGTRRRFSRAWQAQVVAELSESLPHNMAGTSNLLLAKNLRLKPIGTMAHEYIQACQSLGPRLKYSQQFAFERWAREYRGDLGIALSDTYSTDAFLNDFDLYFCKLFDGARQDSGDPIEWTQQILAHYEKNRIDPKTKTLVYSDSLTFVKAIEIYQTFKHRTNLGFGIGTNLTNDVGPKAIDMVIKMVECNGQPVAKISEEPGKTMCKDASYLNYLKQVFHIQ